MIAFSISYATNFVVSKKNRTITQQQLGPSWSTCDLVLALPNSHVGFQIDGQPYVIPMAYGRIEDELILHGAAASRLLAHGARGFPVCATVTLVDALSPISARAKHAAWT